MTSTINFDETNFCEAVIEKFLLDEEIRIKYDLDDEYNTLGEYLRQKVTDVICDKYDSDAVTDNEEYE